MKNILMALVCLLTFSFAKAGDDKPKTEKCSKQCVEQCKKNNCADKECCKLCGQKGCQVSACSKDNAKTTVSMTSNSVKNSDIKTETKTSACCEKAHK